MAPHTWVAAVAPVLVGGALTIGLGVFTPQTMTLRAIIAFILMMIIAILAQSAVNTLNDYADFIKGTDTAENCVDTTDASIIYNNLNPKSARTVAIVCMAVAGVCGVAVVLLSTWILLLLGGIGAATIVLYSAGPKPISYLPVGELISGFVMGVVITVATYVAMSGGWNTLVLLYTIPPFITIALIMQTNNTCDIDRDIEAGRKTLPVLLGMRASGTMIAVANVVVLLFMAAVAAVQFPIGLIVVALAAVLSYKHIKFFATLDYNAETRPAAMGATVKQAAILNLCYVAMILIGAHVNA